MKISQESVRSKQYIALYVQYVTKYFKFAPILKLTFSIWNPVSGIIFSKSKNIFKVIEGRRYGFSDFISIDELNKMKLKKLIIHCHFSEVEKDFKTYKSLLNNELYSDVELHISGRTIPAHKIVLSFSIPFFRKKFAEQDSMTSIEICDTEVEVLKAILMYAYTGKVSCENVETSKLYIAAKQYKIQELEASCFEILKTNSTGDELIRILVDSLKKGCAYSKLQDLAALCAEYIARNKRIILEDYFKDFVHTAPVLFYYTLRAFTGGQGSSMWAMKMRSDILAMCDLSLATQSSQKHFEIYLNNQTLSDVEIQVDDKKYFAHKVIMASRSLVFNRMFSNNMSETISGIVKIEDMESRVFYEVLRFMYTNKFENRDDTVEKMLIAANKYEIDDLKSVCEQILKRKVSYGNSFRLVQFADAHNAEELKKFCFYFIISYECVRGLSDLPMWALSKSHPHLCLEMLHIVYRASGGV